MFRYFLLTAVVFFACNTTYDDQLGDDDILQVENTLQEYRRAWLENDTSVIMGTLSDDVVLFIPGSTARIEGKEDVREFWFPPSDISYPIRIYEISGQEIFGSGIFATAQGRSVLSWQTVHGDSIVSTDTTRTDYLTILRNESGEWRIYRQMYQMRDE